MHTSSLDGRYLPIASLPCHCCCYMLDQCASYDGDSCGWSACGYACEALAGPGDERRSLPGHLSAALAGSELDVQYHSMSLYMYVMMILVNALQSQTCQSYMACHLPCLPWLPSCQANAGEYGKDKDQSSLLRLHGHMPGLAQRNTEGSPACHG